MHLMQNKGLMLNEQECFVNSTELGLHRSMLNELILCSQSHRGAGRMKKSKSRGKNQKME